MTRIALLAISDNAEDDHSNQFLSSVKISSRMLLSTNTSDKFIHRGLDITDIEIRIADDKIL